LPLQEACGNKYSERAPNDPSPPFKEKERGGEGGSKAWWPMEGSMLGGQWNVPSLMANGMFQAWWPMGCSKLSGQWKVPCLVAIGMFQVWWPLEGPKLGGHWKVPSLVANGR